MKTLFDTGAENNAARTLVAEIGPDRLVCGWLDRKDKRFARICYKELDLFESPSAVRNELSFAKNDFDEVVIGSGFPEMLLVPQKFRDSIEAIFRATYPDRANVHIDDISEWQMHTAYQFPPMYSGWLHADFPKASYRHLVTAALKTYNGFVSGDQVELQFSTRHFGLIVKKENSVHLAQIYPYKTPLDVVYFLLKVCQELELDQSTLQLVITGLIERGSALLIEINHYFLNIQFSTSQTFSVPETDLPGYYFTSLHNLATCASSVEI